jgi:hypothetical protein
MGPATGTLPTGAGIGSEGSETLGSSCAPALAVNVAPARAVHSKSRANLDIGKPLSIRFRG